MGNGYVSDGYGDTSFTYRYDSRQDYARAYGYDSPEAYEQARANYEDTPDWGDGLGSGHHPALCSERCPCKTRPQVTSATTIQAAADAA